MQSQCSLVKISASGFMEVFDPEYKYLYMVPSESVVHTPSARLNISRLVICRNYVAGKQGSCVTGAHCKFVHADVDFDMLEAQPIHVNYIWRHEDLCTYKRLPPGRQLNVLLPNEKHLFEEIPSERILVTRAVLAPKRSDTASLTHCVHYYCNRMCNRGESCNFIHTVYVDPNATKSFKRAPAQSMTRQSASKSGSKSDFQHLYNQRVFNQNKVNGSKIDQSLRVAQGSQNSLTLDSKVESANSSSLAHQSSTVRERSCGVSDESITTFPSDRNENCMQQPFSFTNDPNERHITLQSVMTDDGNPHRSCSANRVPVISGVKPVSLSLGDEFEGSARNYGSSANHMLYTWHNPLSPPVGESGSVDVSHVVEDFPIGKHNSNALSNTSPALLPGKGSLRSTSQSATSMAYQCSPVVKGAEKKPKSTTGLRRFYRHNPY